ncbi:MAG TPA: CoA transferase, partial [Acidimicrobiia bacterium]|nr:CoA transferase [Acidimicrobiia bacterium]
MSTVTAREPGVAVARRAVRELCDALGVPLLTPARPGAVGLLEPPVLLRAADGWVHPGPPTVRPEFDAMVASLGGDLSTLPAEVVDAEAGAWMLPAVAVRQEPAIAPRVPWPPVAPRLGGVRVVVLGATWAAPLTGLVLATLGAHVVRVTDPRRLDPFPLRDALLCGCEVRPLDLGDGADRDRFATELGGADLLVDGTTPRVLHNIGLDDPPVARVRIAAFANEDRPGYGSAAECRGGWAARYDPPRLGRVSVVDPVAGLLAVLAAVDVLSSE